MDLYMQTTVPKGHTLLWIAPRRLHESEVGGPYFVTTNGGWWERTFGSMAVAGPLARGLPMGFGLKDWGWREYRSGIETYEDRGYFCRWWLWPLYRLGAWLKWRARYVPLYGLVNLGLMTTLEGQQLRWRDVRPYQTPQGKRRRERTRWLATASAHQRKVEEKPKVSIP